MEGPASMTQQAQKAEPGAVTVATVAAGGAGSRLPDLTYTEQETELRAAVRSVLEEKAEAAAVLARTETPDTYDADLWRTLAAEIGCAGLLIPEAHGGAGASFREAAVVAEEIGRSVAPVPFLGSAVIATVAALASADGELLARLATGSTTAALAVPFDTVPGAGPGPTVRIAGAAKDDPARTYRLSGSVTGV